MISLEHSYIFFIFSFFEGWQDKISRTLQPYLHAAIFTFLHPELSNYHFPRLGLTVVSGQWTCKWLELCWTSTTLIPTYSVSQCRSSKAVKTVPFKTLENFVGPRQINLIFYETFPFLLIFWRLLTGRQNMEKLDIQQANGLTLIKSPFGPIYFW